MKLKIVVLKRKKPLRGGKPIISLYSIVLGVILFSLILQAMGKNFLDVSKVVLVSFTSPSIVLDVLALTMLGYALLLSFKAATWNIGAEGQFFIATMPLVYLLIIRYPEFSLPGLMVTLATLLAGVAGALWAMLAGLIKAYTGINEVPVTLILNYVAYYIVNYLVYYPLRGRYVYGYTRTDELPKQYTLNIYLKPNPPAPDSTPLYPVSRWAYEVAYQLTYYAYWLAVTIIVALTVWFILSKTTLGLRLRALGYNPDFLLASGINVKRYYIIALTVSGFFVGITSAMYLLSYAKRLSYPIEAQTAGYGYLAILVAWLSLLELKYIPVMAYVVGALRNAGIALQITGLGGIEQSLLIIGAVLFSYSILSFLSDYEVKVTR